MTTLNPFPNRYRPLHTNLTDTPPLIIDTEANPQDILEAALQRIRAESASLKSSEQIVPTFYVRTIKHLAQLHR